MKRIIFFITALSLVAISTFAAGGVGVGNGRASYISPKGFSVNYQDELTLQVRSDSAFEISNTALVAQGENASKISFTVWPDKVPTISALEQMLITKYSGKQFQKVHFPGADGYFSETRQDGHLQGIYFVLTTNHDLVEVSIEAFAEGNGLAWVAPIINSFVYDNTPPTIEALRVETTMWPVGSQQKLYFKATDDYAGLREDIWFTFDFINELGIRQNLNFYKIVQIKSEGSDWYSIEIAVPKFLPPGTYTLGAIWLFDRANNLCYLELEKGFPDFYRQRSAIQVPVLKVEVMNAGLVDTQAPEFLEFREEPVAWEAGKNHRLYFRLKDAQSGIDVNSIRCIGGFDSTFKIEDAGFRAKGCTNPRQEGGDWYSLELTLGSFLPSGEYALFGIDFSDLAGNYTVLMRDSISNSPNYGSAAKGASTIPVFKIQIQNNGTEDRAPPKLLEWRVDSTTWKVGETQRLHFRAQDDVSGINVGGHSYGYLIPIERGLSPTIYLDGTIMAEGGEWYGIDVKVSPFIIGGEYYLDQFSFTDKAGAYTNVTCGWEGIPTDCIDTHYGSSLPTMPPIRIQIVR